MMQLTPTKGRCLSCICRPQKLISKVQANSGVQRQRPCKRQGFRCKAAEGATAEAEAPSPESTEASLANILDAVENELADGNIDIQQLGSQIQGLLDNNSRKATEELEKSKTEAQNKYLRLSADFDNFRKRSAAEKERQNDQIRGDVIKQLIPLVDSFEAAQASIKAETEAEKQNSAAYQGLYKQMVEIFKSLGVEAVPGAGQPFDPEYHDAILREENNEVPNETVLQELRRGFKLGNTLLRASMVKVSYTEDPPSKQPPVEE